MLLSELNSVAAEAIEQGLNQVSVRLMVEGFGPHIVHDLRLVGEDAAKRGSADLAQSIVALVDNLTHQSEADGEQSFNTGITELCRMIRNEKAGIPAASAPAYASLGEDAELISDFLVEAREHLSLIEGQLLALERDPSTIEIIHTVFRAFHTIKGLAGFLGFSVMQAVAHEVETLLDLARNEKIRIDTPIVDVVLASADFLLGEMASIDLVLGGAPSAEPADNGILTARIRAVAATAQGSVVKSTLLRVEPATASPSLQADMGAKKKSTPKGRTVKSNKAGNKPIQLTNDLIGLLPAETEVIPEDEEDFFQSSGLADLLSVSPTADPATLMPAVEAKLPKAEAQIVTPLKAAEATRTSEPVKAVDSGSVRVETAKLDYLMDMVGEMVIAQSLIRHSQVLMSTTDSRLIGDLSHLARVTAEVQRATMSMRMVPVANLFQKIERVIRDLSRKAGKQVVLQTSGTDTEVDKTVAEELSDPLLHMVRNSVDHGIETAEERAKAGKPETATIKLAAYHQGGQIVIEISDDGRGLNAERIQSKAEQNGIISSGSALSETEIYQLIFAPGFSTAEKITDVSGRGVGMDVVRRNVEKLRGRIETHSELGKGTTFLLKLPLTLAIIDGLVVEVGNNHYIVPLSVVREIFRPLPSALFSIEGREEMVLVREQLLPVVRLNQRLGITSRIHLPSEGLLVVIESENKLYCMLVDDLLGKQEVVIKSLGQTFQDASGFSGCAVLGDGRVGLILDTDGIYRGRRR